jgi:hypothetical protein
MGILTTTFRLKCKIEMLKDCKDVEIEEILGENMKKLLELVSYA